MRTTHIYAILEISDAAYNEVAAFLRKAGYDHAFHATEDGGELIDMHGIALQRRKPGRHEITGISGRLRCRCGGMAAAGKTAKGFEHDCPFCGSYGPGKARVPIWALRRIRSRLPWLMKEDSG